MNKFLVSGTVEVTQYMVDDSYRSSVEMLIVNAYDEDHAVRKFENFWREKTSEYSVYYNVHSVKAMKEI